MNLTLNRTQHTPDGIFGELTNENGTLVFVTLEHSYDLAPKIPVGEYVCQRGSHRLASMVHPFETFEVTGVEGHTNILFHMGNYNRDSEGCILVGKSVLDKMIVSSREAFDEFMEMQKGVGQFSLTVKS